MNLETQIAKEYLTQGIGFRKLVQRWHQAYHLSRQQSVEELQQKVAVPEIVLYC